MSSEISSVAKSRARYYCKGAPVQFVQVELLRMQENNNMIVTLTFKNIAPQTMTGLTAHFRCKGVGGAVVMEDNFTYANLSVGEGELFGGDDAVFVSEQPLTSVEVSLVQVEYGPDLRHNLQRCQPVPLPTLKQLSASAAQAVNTMLKADSVRHMPANVADGWQCGCGAFNYNIGRSKDVCDECGIVKMPLLSAVRLALQREQGGGAQPVKQSATPQRLPGMVDWNDESQMDSYESMGSMNDFNSTDDAVPANAGYGDTAQYDKLTDYDELAQKSVNLRDDNSKTAVMSAQRGSNAVALMNTETADFIMKFAPFITLGASATYVVVLLVVNMLVS